MSAASTSIPIYRLFLILNAIRSGSCAKRMRGLRLEPSVDDAFLLTPQLPYVRQNIKTDMANLGYKNRSKTLAESILKLTDGLGLSIVRENGFPCDVQYLQAGGDVLVGLSAVRAQEVLEDKTGKKKVQDDAEPVRGSTWRPKYEPQPTYKRSVPIEKLDESHKYPQVETVELIPDHTEEDA